MQVNLKLQAAQERMRRMQGVISTDAEAEKCLSGMLEKLHRRLVGLVSASPEVFAGDHKARDLHVAPRVNEMLEKYTDQVEPSRLSFVLICVMGCFEPILVGTYGR